MRAATSATSAADVIVLNKVDVVSRTRLDSVRGRFTHAAARVLEATHADVPPAAVLGVGGASARRRQRSGGHDHAAAFATWTWTASEPLAYGAIRRALASLPASVFRAKGFLLLAEAPEQRVVVHLVGRRVEMRPLGPWNGAEPRTELVFVGLDPDVDRLQVDALPAASLGEPAAV